MKVRVECPAKIDLLPGRFHDDALVHLRHFGIGSSRELGVWRSAESRTDVQVNH